MTAKRFLQSLAVSTYRLIETQSETAYDESFCFQGNSLAELLQHMMNKGLEFAQPEPSDEDSYRRLFSSVRALYLKAVPKPEEKRLGK